MRIRPLVFALALTPWTPLSSGEETKNPKGLSDHQESHSHWAFQSLSTPSPSDSSLHPIDSFVRARLRAEGLSPESPASPATLARRVALDLTGLPPDEDVSAAYLRSPNDETYEAMVDDLLASPGFGERWASVWLDLARYADTKGYEKDTRREIWRYRDWVIDAFNRDLPFDEFTIHQIAGDLLPDPRLLPTAFHRNTMSNDEGGTDDEEFRVAAVKDRVDTTAQVWMGLTFSCAKCHTHKYDPISIEEYYQFYDFFNQTEDADRADDAPRVSTPTEDQARDLARIEGETEQSTQSFEALAETAEASMATWERSHRERYPNLRWNTDYPSDLEDSRLGTWMSLGPLSSDEGRSAFETVYSPQRDLDHSKAEDPWATRPEWPSTGIIPLQAEPYVATFVRRVIESPEPRTARLSLGSDDGLRVWWNGDLVKELDTYRGVAKAQLVLDVDVRAGENELMIEVTNGTGEHAFAFEWKERRGGMPLELARIFTLPAPWRTKPQRALLQDFYLRNGHPQGASLIAQLEELEAEKGRLERSIPKTPVLRELPPNQRRVTHQHLRGNFLDPGPVVHADVPAAFHPWPKESPRNRLGLAQWLVSKDNPLTARVVVNRYWARFFGRGLVETEEDFGTQGTPPSHPALLDWLASDLVDHEWSLKHLCKAIVLSKTYRQSSERNEAKRIADPHNRLLSRGPRVRLSAEAVRDVTLAASGLLERRLYGPSVMPPQPDGIWQTVYSIDQWVTSEGRDRYRRGLYTFIRRTSPYPSMLTFDAPSREICTPRRIRTNTPLQALVTLNDPVFVEAARALAQLSTRASNGNIDDAITFAMKRALIRTPHAGELDLLRGLYDRRKIAFAATPREAEAYWGASDEKAPHFAAMTTVCQVILNLDEFLTKG